MTSKPIRRPSRLGAVWLTYRTRPLMWLCAAGFVLRVTLMTLDPNSPWHRGTSMKGALPQTPRPAPVTHVSIGADGRVAHGRQPDWATLRSLTVYSGVDRCEPLWTPGAMPQLESLTLYESVGDHRIAKLCELYDLKALELPNANSLTTVAMEHLSNESRLEFLSLGGVSARLLPPIPGMTPENIEQERSRHARLIHHAPEVAWPTGLKTLIYDDVGGATAARLHEWRKLTELRCLATRLIPVGGSRLADETLDELRQFPKLRQLFLHEFPKHVILHGFPVEGDELASVQQQLLPNLIVRPFYYDTRRVVRAGLIVFHALILFTVLAMQFSAQFVTPARGLTPGFARWHIGVVALATTLVVLVALGLSLMARCSFMAAIGMCGLPVFMMATGARCLRSLLPTLPGFTNFGLVMPMCMFPFLAAQFAYFAFGAEFDWYLRGHVPWLALAAFVGGAWGGFDLVAWHLRLRRDLEESGTANVPLGMFDIGGWAEWGKSLAAAKAGEGKQPAFAYRLFDARMERFIEQMQQRKSTTSLALWRLGGAGSALNMLRFSVVILIVLSIFIGVPVAWLAPEWWSQFGSVLVAPMVFQLLGGGLIMPLAFAWARRPMLELELLRPVSRCEWASTWFRGVASEIAPVLLVSIAFGAALQWTGLLGSWSMRHVSLAAVLVVGIMGIIFAVGMWTVTLKSLWQVALVAGIAWIAVVLCIVTPILQQSHIHEWQTPAILIPTLVGLYTMALAGLYLAWWRWQNWEVGQAT